MAVTDVLMAVQHYAFPAWWLGWSISLSHKGQDSISTSASPSMSWPIKSRRSDVAVLFVTGYVGEGEGDDLVGYDLLRKPFTVSTLASAVAGAPNMPLPPKLGSSAGWMFIARPR